MPDVPVPDASASLIAEHEFLLGLSQVVASNSEMQPILDWVVHKTTALLQADDGSIKLLGPDADTPTAQTIVRKHSPGLESRSWEMPVATSVMGFLLHKGEALVTPDLLDDPRFPGLRKVTSRVRAVLAVPLRVGNRITGMLAVTNREPGRAWTPGEVQLLSIVATNSAGVIEQARLRVEAQEKQRLEEENRRMERELDLARDIQMSLVPSKSLVLGTWHVHGRVVPARQVGGDYFDFFPLREGKRIGVTIADVSGKGVPASLLMSNVQASLRAFCDGERPVSDAITKVNRSVARAVSGGKFITLFYAEIDVETGVVRYVNAGHNYPLLRRRDARVEELTVGGLILGLMEDAVYEQGETRLDSGDALLLYSDGLSEAMDPLGRQFGDDRLGELWRTAGHVPIATSIDHLMTEILGFRGIASQSDDMTAVVVGQAPAA